MRTNTRLIRARQQTGQAGLISLLVVILIIMILAATMYPKIAGRNEYDASGGVKGAATPTDRAYDVTCTMYMQQVAQAAGMYRQDHNAPPPDLQALKAYGVTKEMIDTPNCNFGLPKVAPPKGAAPAAPANPGYTVYSQPSSAPAPTAAPPAAAGMPPPRPGQTTVVGPGGMTVHVPTSSSTGYDAGGGQ